MLIMLGIGKTKAAKEEFYGVKNPQNLGCYC